MDAVAAAAAGTPLRGDAVVRDPRKLDVDPYGAGERYGAARKLAASGDTDALIASLKASELRGMGGAGFPTGLKWEIVRNAPGDDEVRRLQRRRERAGHVQGPLPARELPHLLVEGMILAGLVTGARQGIVYIRHEYEAQIEIVEHEIATATGGRRCSGPTSSAPAARSSWRCSSAPAATSAARSRRCWRRWRASAPSRATSRRSPAPTACTASRRSSTTSRRS